MALITASSQLGLTITKMGSQKRMITHSSLATHWLVPMLVQIVDY